MIVTSLAAWQRVEQRPPPGVAEGVGALLISLTVLTLAAITVVPEFLATQPVIGGALLPKSNVPCSCPVDPFKEAAGRHESA